MKSVRYFVAFAALVGCALVTQQANAQGPYGYAFGSRGYFNPYLGNCFGASPYSLGRVPTPPYFALHPPVYYSGITPTTYGGSPFPKPQFPVFQQPQPVINSVPAAAPIRSVQESRVVMNPFVREPSKPIESQSVRTVKVIHNPFVRSETRVVSSRTSQ